MCVGSSSPILAIECLSDRVSEKTFTSGGATGKRLYRMFKPLGIGPINDPREIFLIVVL